jgi:hypothetical protein
MSLFSNGRWTWPWVAIAVLSELNKSDRRSSLDAIHHEQDARSLEAALRESSAAQTEIATLHHFGRPIYPGEVAIANAALEAEQDRIRNQRLSLQRTRIYG